LGQRLFSGDELEELDDVARQPPHQEDVENEDDDVEQQTAVFF
jgi:hypothetical protein